MERKEGCRETEEESHFLQGQNEKIPDHSVHCGETLNWEGLFLRVPFEIWWVLTTQPYAEIQSTEVDAQTAACMDITTQRRLNFSKRQE